MTTFGVLGGQGAFATAKLHQMIVEHALQCGASNDEDFPNLIIQSFPPSALGVHSNLPELILKTSELFNGNVDKVVASFNTSYVNEAFMKQAFGRDKFISIVDLVSQSLPANSKVFVLDTESSEAQRLFENNNDGHNTFFYPETALVEDLILAGKRNQTGKAYTQKQLVELMVIFNQQECDVVLLGCTDLSVFAPALIEAGVAHVDALKLVSNYIIAEHYRNAQN